jgi:N-acetylglucosaminyldiphosphoundecaprenol N-acetyl-beta-D-mannosaminyltransferase
VPALGLEWLFRVIQEPTRLGPRYLKTNAAFTMILLKALLARYVTAK